MPRFRIIILERDDRKIDYVMWADVPAARQPFYAAPGKMSAWKDALAIDNTALQMGQVVEEAGHEVMEPGYTAAQSRTKLINTWTEFQNRITALNKWDRYGTTWDGTTWTAAGVA